MSLPPLVSVIVPVLNGAATLSQCLLSILRSDYPPDRREVVVVDNGSTDDSPRVAAQLPVTLLHEPHRGAAAARNRGIEASRGEIVAFTDADCAVTAGWIRELVRMFDAPHVAAVEGEVLPFPATTPSERYAVLTGSHSRPRRSNGAMPDFLVTANLAVRRAVFSRIGMFDTRFPGAGGEDVDFSWRLLRDPNFELRFAPRAVVFHRHRTTVWGLFTQRLSYGYGRALLHRKYPDHEGWGWRQERAGYRALVRTAWRAVGSLLPGIRGRYPAESRSALTLSLVAGLGHRIGFAGGALRRGGRQ